MLSLTEFRRAICSHGLALSDDPPHFESHVATPWGSKIPAAARIDRATGIGQMDYLRWLEEVLDEVRSHDTSHESSNGNQKGGITNANASAVEPA